MDVEGRPGEDAITEKSIREFETQNSDTPNNPETKEPVRIMIDIRMTNGMQIRQKNLSFGRLKKLVENLENLFVYIIKYN